MTENVSPEMVERMIALLRSQVAKMDGETFVTEGVAEARAIVAALPAPIDPDLVLARNLASAAVFYGQTQSHNGGRDWKEFRDGECDAGDLVSGIFTALKSRTLATQGDR
jgi:hypothetical protein